ncbi:hypothetical protein ABEB36_015113 [Hypothenemus hampei]|uniref:Uncharacterized protein n=1 Tax=Hypothenemus hampei TaxID=57062 RepID=A0ABD1E1E4_HYPHA
MEKTFNSKINIEKIVIDYLLIKFDTQKRSVYYIAKVQEVLDENSEFRVTFLRKYKKGLRFPDIEDVAIINKIDIVYKLPEPKDLPGTSRMADILKFDIEFFDYDIQ